MSKKETAPTPINHADYVGRDVSDVMALLEKIEQNEVLLGVTVLGKREGEPSPKRDSAGNPTGDFYPAPLYVDIAFQGGQIQQRVPSREIFDKLQEGKRYTMRGRVEVYNSTATSQSGNEYVRSSMVIRLLDFHAIYETFGRGA